MCVRERKRERERESERETFIYTERYGRKGDR